MIIFCFKNKFEGRHNKTDKIWQKKIGWWAWKIILITQFNNFWNTKKRNFANNHKEEKKKKAENTNVQNSFIQQTPTLHTVIT